MGHAARVAGRVRAPLMTADGLTPPSAVRDDSPEQTPLPQWRRPPVSRGH